MWWKLTGVWVATALIFGSLFLLPVETHVVKLDMPRGASNPAADQVAHIIIGGTGVLILVIVLAILSIPFWLSWRIVRRHRKSD